MTLAGLVSSSMNISIASSYRSSAKRDTAYKPCTCALRSSLSSRMTLSTLSSKPSASSNSPFQPARRSDVPNLAFRAARSYFLPSRADSGPWVSPQRTPVACCQSMASKGVLAEAMSTSKSKPTWRKRAGSTVSARRRVSPLNESAGLGCCHWAESYSSTKAQIHLEGPKRRMVWRMLLRAG